MRILHGQGLNIKRDLANAVKDGNFDSFKAKYGEALTNFMFDNFAHPLLQSMNNVERQNHIVSKLGLFCAAFLNPIE